MDNSDFTINELCQKMAMSRTLLYEKLKAITGQSPSEFIRIIRLRYAKELLMSGKYSVPTVATMTGFINAKYFSTVFKNILVIIRVPLYLKGGLIRLAGAWNKYDRFYTKL